jgi:hypothetical protein
MDFIDQLQTLAAKVPKLCDVLQTEEATKNALVMPFINILGYDIFDPTEFAAAGGETDDSSTKQDVIETTAEELEGFYIIKSLLRKAVDPNRIAYRDTLSYFGVLLDDNNRKPLARLYFNRSQKYLGTFDESRKETRVPIGSLDDIYQHSKELLRVLKFYESEKSTTDSARSKTEPKESNESEQT